MALKYEDYIKLEEFLLKNYLFRQNMVTGNIEFKDRNGGGWQELNEFDIYRQLKLGALKITLNELIYILKSNFVPEYRPLLEYFKGLKLWKPEEDPNYIGLLCSYIKTKNPARLEMHFKKWFIRAIKCALEDDFINKNAIILVHDKQNSGKTTFIRYLCPKSLRAYFTENISFDKDSMIALIENFIINLDELATFTKVEINALKSILSKSFVKERHPFERKAKKLPRRASFIGSTNMTEFLTDPTGNVRWIPFDIYAIDWNYSKDVNIDDVWRQAYSLYLSGFPCEITAEEVKENELENRAFTVVSTEMELVMKYYIPGNSEDYDLFRTATEIEKAIRKEENSFLKISTRQLGRALKMLDFVKGNRYDESKAYPIKAYYLKFREK